MIFWTFVLCLTVAVMMIYCAVLFFVHLINYLANGLWKEDEYL